MNDFLPPQPSNTTSAGTAAIARKSVNQQIVHALLSIASAALLIRVAGMLNQVVVSARFGAGAAMDAYFVASLLPLLIAQLIIGALEASVIPVYTHIQTYGTQKQKSVLFSTLLNLLLAGTVPLTLLVLLFRQQMIFLSAPALDAFRAGLAVELTSFIFPVLLLMVIIGFLECILNTAGQFGWPAYAGILVPLTTTLLVLVVGKFLGVVMLIIGMMIGLCLQLCVSIMRIRRLGLIYRPTIDLRNPAIASILIAAWPVLFGACLDQASPFVDQIFASTLSTGSISAINYSLKIISVPVGVIFMSVGRALLPHLSHQASINERNAGKETLRLFLWIVGSGTIVLTVFMFVLAHPLVQLLFQRGAFSAIDTERIATTFRGFTPGLIPMALGFITSKTFSALGKTKVLMGVSTFMVIANAILDSIFAHFWQSFGIALATSVVYFCTMFILFFTLRRMIGKLDLFTPPPKLLEVVWRRGIGKYYMQWITRKEEPGRLLSIPSEVHRRYLRIAAMLTVFAIGVVGVLLNSVYTLRAAFGSLIILAFLRYRYILLIAWVLINAFIGSGLPIFSGSNFLTGLTVPTLLLLTRMPIRQTFKHMPALAFLFLYLLWVLASIGISTIGLGPFLTLWFTFLDYVAIGVLTINVLTTRRRMMGLIDAILFASTCIALYGIYGYITRQNGILDPTTGLFRITSVFGSAPTLALFLSITIPLAFYRTFTLRSYKRISSLTVLLISLIALGLTFTRTTFISIPLSLIIIVFFLPSRKIRMGMLAGILALAVLVVLLVIVGHVPIFARFFNQDVLTLNGRIYLWRAILDHFDPAQLLGNGLNASQVLLTELQVRDNRGVISTAPHNVFLGALYDHGIIGVILLTVVFIVLFGGLIAGIRGPGVRLGSQETTMQGTRANSIGDEQRMLFAVALAVLTSVLVQSLESNDIWIQGIGLYFWMVMALPFALGWRTPKQPRAIAEASMVNLKGWTGTKTTSAAHSPAQKISLIRSTSYSSKPTAQVVAERIRICIISLMFSPIVGGAEVRAERQARQLQALGHDVIVVTLRHDKRWKRTEMLAGLPVVRVGGIFRRGGQLRIGRLGHLPCDIGILMMLWRLRHYYDVIHVCQTSSLATVAALIGKLAQKPVISSIQNTGPDERQRTQLEWGAMLMADTLPSTSSNFLKIDFQAWAPSDGDITYLSRAGLGGQVMLNFLRKSNTFYQALSTRSHSYLTSHGFRAEQVVHIPNGVDTEKFRPAPERQPDPTRPERDIICVARLEYSKGVDVLLHAWGRMMHASADWRIHLKPRLRLVGSGVFSSQMERIVAELGIQDSVEFLGPRRDVIDLLQQSWSFVLPSRWEGMPNALLEAMACGLPCVATRVSGSEDIISDGISGLLVEPEQPAELAQALHHIIEDTDLAQRLGQAGRATVIRDYQLIHVVERYLELYHRLLTRGEFTTDDLGIHNKYLPRKKGESDE